MERNEHERLAWLQLAFTPYIGAESFLALHRHFGSARAALAAPVDAVRGLLRQKQALRDWGRDNPLALKAVEAALNWEAQPDCRLMLLSDEDFPLMLTEGITPPPVLFLRGNTALLQRPAVAVVGSRHATPQALRIARDFGEAISEQEIAVVCRAWLPASMQRRIKVHWPARAARLRCGARASIAFIRRPTKIWPTKLPSAA